MSTALAIVLDPAKTHGFDPDARAATIEIVERLDAVWRPGGPRSWMWVTREMISGRQERCVAICSRP